MAALSVSFFEVDSDLVLPLGKNCGIVKDYGDILSAGIPEA